MQTHNIKRKNPNYKSDRVGRGGKRGKTSGRGTKGQNARAGRKKRPEMRDIIKKLPKLRGRGKNINKTVKHYSVFTTNLEIIEKLFSKGDKITPSSLVKAGIVNLQKGKNPKVKILGKGDLTKSLNVSGCATSSEAKTKIEKAGGTVK